MSISGTTINLDDIEVGCSLIEPNVGSRPHLSVELSLIDRSQNREREVYLPVQSSFYYIGDDGSSKVIGPGIDLSFHPIGLSDPTIPRLQPMILMLGVELDLPSISVISTAIRKKSAIFFEVRFVAPLLNDVRTIRQRMLAFTPAFRFATDITKWNTWLSRWQERYVPSDLSKNVPPEIASDYAEGVRCLNVEAYRACVVMLRRSLEAAAIEKGGVGRDLLSVLQDMVDKKNLSKADHALASGVRLFGNYGAHPSTDELSSVSRDDAELVLAVTRQLLKKMFGQV